MTQRNIRLVIGSLFALMLLAGCQRGSVQVVYSCEGTVSQATVIYTDIGGSTRQDISLPWSQTVTLPERSGVPTLKVEISDEQEEISCNIHVDGDTGSDALPGPEIIVRDAESEG